jgi:hypothetical protein
MRKKKLRDNKLIRDLKIGLKEAKEGKTRPLKELISELGLNSYFRE